MRDNWWGNSALQERLMRADPEAHVILEAIRTVASDIVDTATQWRNGSGSGSGFSALLDGGAKITGASSTLVERTTNNGAVVTDLDLSNPFSAVEIEWPELGDGADREIDQLTVRVDPDAAGTGVEVTHWAAMLLRVSNLHQEEGEISLQPLHATPVIVEHGGGTSEEDVTFNFKSSDRANGPVVGPPPDINQHRIEDEGADPSSDPRTYIFLWALKGEGEKAGNVAWVGDTGSSGVESFGAGVIRHVQVDQIDKDTERQQPTLGGKWIKTGTNSGMPKFALKDRSFSSVTITFSGSDKIDLGASPSEEVEVVAVGQTPSDSDLTWELAVPGSGSWVEVADGDVIGEDNTATGGNDLSSFSARQDYDARVTLNPSTAAFVSPIARRFGVRERERTDLEGIATLKSWSRSVDPVTLKSEIAEAKIEIIKDGITDYRDFFTELFSDNHIGQVEFRAWVGSSQIDRRYWLHLDDFLVDETASAGAHGEVICVDSLILLRGLIPVYSSGTRQPKEYSNSLLSDAYDDIVTGQLSIPSRRLGPGVADIRIDSDGGGTPDDDARVTKTIEEADGKAEAEALAWLAGGSLISSQGRIKFQSIHPEHVIHPSDGSPRIEDPTPNPVEIIPQEEVAVRTISPGYSERVVEMFTPWGWSERSRDGQGSYSGEVRAFHSTGLTKLGDAQVRDGEPPRLDDRIAKWIPQSGTDGSGNAVSGLAEKVTSRQVASLGTGLIMVRFRTTYPRPHLERGDVVAVQTDRLVARHPSTDTPLRGLLWLLGPVVAIGDPMGRDLTIWVRNYEDILPGSATLTRQNYARPGILSATVHAGVSGGLDISVNANLDAGGVAFAVSDSGFPGKSTVRAQSVESTDADGNAVYSAGGSWSVGQTVWVSGLAFENSDGTGAESTLWTAKLTVNQSLVGVTLSGARWRPVGQSWPLPNFGNNGSHELDVTLELGEETESVNIRITGTNVDGAFDENYDLNVTPGDRLQHTTRHGDGQIDPSDDKRYTTPTSEALIEVTPYDAADGAQGSGEAGESRGVIMNAPLDGGGQYITNTDGDGDATTNGDRIDLGAGLDQKSVSNNPQIRAKPNDFIVRSASDPSSGWSSEEDGYIWFEP